MSMVYITKHEENIYNLDKFDKAGEEQKFAFQKLYSTKSRYVSHYHEKVIKKNFDVINIAPFRKIVATKSGIGYHKTMGCAQQPVRQPCDFLRKHEGIKWRRLKEHVCGKSLRPVPPIPKISELPKKIPRLEKNMIRINIEKIRNAAVRRPKPKYAITFRGETRELCNSGIMPAYIFSPNFGRLPKYILDFNKILCDDKCKVYSKEPKYQNQSYRTKDLPRENDLYMLDPAERLEVIEGLKKNWYEKQLMFQRLPVVLDVSSIKPRRKLESDLHQLEEDIVLLEYNPKIYICN